MSDQSDSAIENVSDTGSSALLGQIKSFAAGGIGGVCAVLTGHPFDLLKVRQQTSGGSLGDSVKYIVKHDGPRGFYRGVGAPLIGVTPMFAVSFWGYDVGQRIARKAWKLDDLAPLNIAQISAAGFISAIPMTAITAPFERIKVVLQLQGQGQGQGPKLTGPMSALKHIYSEGGVRSVFKGSVATLARDGPGSALYFAAYEAIKRYYADPVTGVTGLDKVLIAGGCAGVAMWVPVFPIDTIKSNLQSSSEKIGIGEVTRKIYARGGIKAFFPGVAPALLRSFPANAATFAGVELTHRAFKAAGI